MMSNSEMLIERINNERNIHEFVDEKFLINNLKSNDYHDLNWMKVFNSKIALSNEFIISYANYIDWKWLTRPLEENLLLRYSKRVVQWNAQLYGSPLTFEFLTLNKKKFDWQLLSKCPPDWFNDLHFEVFGSYMDWKLLTKYIGRMRHSVILQYANYIDWEWVTVNAIRGETFAKHFIGKIDWSHPHLDTSCLSTEFLFEMTKNIDANEDSSRFIPIGATITNKFAIKYQYHIDWIELSKKGLITSEMKTIGVV